MPSNPLHQNLRPLSKLGRTLPFLVGTVSSLVGGRGADAQSLEPVSVRSRQVELHYRLIDADEGAKVQLWYTRDRAATWQAGKAADESANPILFNAPAEGLYGFILAVKDSQETPKPPEPGALPQRWVFIDYTPPLAQWDSVEPGDDFDRQRDLHLRWTAYDDHLLTRPITLAAQSSVDGKWQTIDSNLPNSGRYDWRVPKEMAGQLSLKLTVTDQGGHAVERVYGPLPTDRWIKTPALTTRPALVSTTQPAGQPVATQPAAADMEHRLKAQDLLRQGEASVQRGQYAVASERFREALEADPDLLPAISNLANIYYLQQDYVKAVGLYDQVLAKDAKNLPAMRGAALAYVAMKQYPQSRDVLQRLLGVNDKDAQAWLDLGDVQFMMGDTTQARTHWNQAAAADATADAIIRKAKRRLEMYGAASSE